MDIFEFRRVRSLLNYDVTPEWVLHPLAIEEKLGPIERTWSSDLDL